MCLMRLGDTNNPMIDKFLYFAYIIDNHMEEHAPNLNNTDIFPSEGHQVPGLIEDDEANQD